MRTEAGDRAAKGEADMVEKVIIMGAAGRDFHNFNVYFRDNQRYRVVCFTATQIPDIDGRLYPPQLAGSLYPQGIPIESDKQLMELIKAHQVDLVVYDQHIWGQAAVQPIIIKTLHSGG